MVIPIHSKTKRLAIKAIIIFIIAFFISTSFALAGINLTDEDVERIKSGLDLMKSFTNFTIIESKIKNILNTVIEAGEVSTDITYGLLILSSLNEMDLIDLVISQRYKMESRNYFNSILDERLNLFNYYKGIAYDVPKLLSKSISGPISALTLNTFSITNEVIDIFIVFENIKTIKFYDGLWVYFDLRQYNESHTVAWEDAKLVMGWANPDIYWRFREKQREREIEPIESQFATLFYKWSPHVSVNKGIKEEIKKELKAELRDSLTFAVDKYKIVEEKEEPSFLEKIQLSFSNVLKGVKDIGSLLANTAKTSQDAIENLIKGTDHKQEGTIPFPQEEEEEEKETATPPGQIEKAQPQPIEEDEEEITLEEIQKVLDEVSGQMDNFEQRVKTISQQRKTATSTKDLYEKEEISEEKAEDETEIDGSSKEEIICQRMPGDYPSRNKIIINEIAWMGTVNSSNDEWIELKNISGDTVNLKGWQVIDKNQDIKITIEEDHNLEHNKFFLLERTDDTSIAGITADFIYTGTLNNQDETIYLFDENCYLRDEIKSISKWPAGSNSSKRTMERKPDLLWQTSNEPGGTPKKRNSSGFYDSTGGGGGGGSSSPTPQIPILGEQTIIITEIQIENASGSNYDFIELYNFSTTTSVNVSGLQLKKKSSTGKEYSVVVFKDYPISPKDYLLWANYKEDILPDITTSQTLSKNNSIALLNKEKKIIDAVSWGSSTDPFIEGKGCSNPETNQTLGRRWSSTTNNYIDSNNNHNDFEFQTPTPRSQNKPMIYENKKPVASFIFIPEKPTEREVVAFDASESYDEDGEIFEFLWNFGDGSSTSTFLPTTTHSFQTSEDFIVTLHVVDGSGATSSLASTTVKVEDEFLENPSLQVVINEIAWMGTPSSSFDEWIELYNNTSSSIDLYNWTLTWNHENKSHTIVFSTSSAHNTVIAGESFYLIERTDDDAVSDVAADFTGSFGHGVNNQGERTELRDREGNLVDIVNCLSGWFAGKASPQYITMERINSHSSGTTENWAANNLISRNGHDVQQNKINGTPKAENSVSKKETVISNLNDLPFDDFNELILTFLGNPYIFQNNLHVPEGKVLYIEPAVSLKFDKNKLAYIEGSLIGIGGQQEKIIFTSNNQEAWAGIRFEQETANNQATSQLEYVKIENAKRCRNISCSENVVFSIEDRVIVLKNADIKNTAGAEIGIWSIYSSSSITNTNFSNFDIGIHIKGGSPEIENCSFSSNNYGLYIDNKSNVVVKNNIFENNIKPIYFIYSFPFLGNNTLQNNTINGISVGGLISTTTFYGGATYILETGEITEKTVLIPQPGTVVKMEDSTINVRGKILVPNISGPPVVFTSLKDDDYGGDTNNDGNVTKATSSDWYNLFFKKSGSIINNIIIRYGGREGSPSWMNVGTISLDEEIKITIKNSVIEKSVFAVSFPSGTACEDIKKEIQGFEAQKTVFQDNKYLTYPKCSW